MHADSMVIFEPRDCETEFTSPAGIEYIGDTLTTDSQKKLHDIQATWEYAMHRKTNKPYLKIDSPDAGVFFFLPSEKYINEIVLAFILGRASGKALAEGLGETRH